MSIRPHGRFSHHFETRTIEEIDDSVPSGLAKSFDSLVLIAGLDGRVGVRHEFEYPELETGGGPTVSDAIITRGNLWSNWRDDGCEFFMAEKGMRLLEERLLSRIAPFLGQIRDAEIEDDIILFPSALEMPRVYYELSENCLRERHAGKWRMVLRAAARSPN